MMADVTRRPPAAVLAGFDVDAATLEPLSGGQGMAWRAEGLVLKPLDMSLEALAWQEAVLSDIAEDGFRLARPVRSRRGELAIAGWSAWQWLGGQHLPGRWADIAAAGERFHRATAHIPPPSWHRRRTDPFATADRAAWDAEVTERFTSLPVIAQLAAQLRPVQGRDQLIHGDLSGNVLFCQRLAPGIIDLSPYWRPPLFATAVIAVDAMVWEGADQSIRAILRGHPDAPQYLLRAAIFRVVMDRLCNPQRHEPPPWWTSLLYVTAQLCHLAASAPTAAVSPSSSGKPCEVDPGPPNVSRNYTG
jgi:uncharacterized protein (TIGR02569 family)